MPECGQIDRLWNPSTRPMHPLEKVSAKRNQEPVMLRKWNTRERGSRSREPKKDKWPPNFKKKRGLWSQMINKGKIWTPVSMEFRWPSLTVTGIKRHRRKICIYSSDIFACSCDGCVQVWQVISLFTGESNIGTNFVFFWSGLSSRVSHRRNVGAF